MRMSDIVKCNSQNIKVTNNCTISIILNTNNLLLRISDPLFLCCQLYRNVVHASVRMTSTMTLLKVPCRKSPLSIPSYLLVQDL